MNFRTTLWLAFLTFLFANWILFVEPRLKTTKNFEFENRFLLTFEPQHCTEILFRQGTLSLRLKQNNSGNFYIEEPQPRIQANELLVTKILGRFGNLFRSHVSPIRPNPNQTESDFFQSYGLDTPKAQITFQFSAQAPITFSFGKLEGPDCYVRLQNTSKIHVLPRELFVLATPELETMRDPYLLHLNSHQLSEIVLHSSDQKEIRLLKTKTTGIEQWQQVSPHSFQVDSDQIFLWIDALKNQQISQHLLYSEYSELFQTPWKTLILTEEKQGEKTQQTFHFQVKENILYAHQPHSPWVFSCKGELFLRFLSWPAWKYIHREIFPVLEPEALSFTLGTQHHIQYQKEQGQWVMQTPENTKAIVPEEWMQVLIEAIIHLQMIEPLAWEPESWEPYQLEQASHRWQIREKEKQYELWIGIPAGNNNVYARRLDIPLLFVFSQDVLKGIWSRLGEGEAYKSFHRIEKELEKYLEKKE